MNDPESKQVPAAEDKRLKRYRRVLLPGELTDRQIEAIRSAQVPTEFAHLDDELADWKP